MAQSSNQSSNQNNAVQPYGAYFGSDFLKGMMPSGTLFPYDFSALFETQRRNLQAVTEAQKMIAENLQAIAQRQGQILSQLLEDNTALARQIMTEGTPEEKATRQADLVRNAYEHSVSGLSELADMVRDSSKESGEIINKRVTASLGEFKNSISKPGQELKKAA